MENIDIIHSQILNEQKRKDETVSVVFGRNIRVDPCLVVDNNLTRATINVLGQVKRSLLTLSVYAIVDTTNKNAQTHTSWGLSAPGERSVSGSGSWATALSVPPAVFAHLQTIEATDKRFCPPMGALVVAKVSPLQQFLEVEPVPDTFLFGAFAPVSGTPQLEFISAWTTPGEVSA